MWVGTTGALLGHDPHHGTDVNRYQLYGYHVPVISVIRNIWMRKWPKMRTRSIACFALAMLAMLSDAFGEPQTKENSKGITVNVSGLQKNMDDSCHPGTFDGLVVKRSFADDAVTLTGITLEFSDGVRTFINVDTPPDMNMALRSRVFDGLQRLSNVGRHVMGQFYACGAA